MPIVDTPIAWYYPLTYTLGNWTYKYGDTLVCQLWECDGGPGGCDPSKPTVRPSAAAGDDLLGQASISLGAFQLLGAAYLNMTVPTGGKGEEGSNSGSILLGCPGCRQLLRDNPSWVNPYSAPTQQTPTSGGSTNNTTGAVTTPPVAISPPSPPSSPVPAPAPPLTSFEGPPATESIPQSPAASPPSPPVSEIPSTVAPIEPLPVPPPPPPTVVVPPSPSAPPPSEEIKQDEPVVVPEPVETAKNSTKMTLVIVLSVVGAILAILLITMLCCVWYRRGWRTIKPDNGAQQGKPTTRKTSNRHLRIRVQRPADADAALRQHRVAGAIAELPWAPKTRV